MSLKLLKPRVLKDIQVARTESVFRPAARRVNLSYRKGFKVSSTEFAKWCIAAASTWFLILGSVAAPTTTTLAADQTGTVSAAATERAQLEAQLKDLEGQINQYENQVSAYQKQGNSLKGEVNRLNAQIAKLNLQIKAVNLTLAQLNTKISDTSAKITATEESIEDKKATLAKLLKTLYESDKENLMQIFLKNPQLSDFFSDVNSMEVLQRNVRDTITQISQLRDELKDQHEQFSLAKADAETIRDYQVAQKQESDQVKAQKNQLIAVTKGQEAKYQEMLAQTKKTAAEIRSRIFQLLGGGELSFAQAYDYAKMASGFTGVRPAIILAVLDRESALGQNVGKCTYDQINSTTGKPTMHPTRDLPIFLDIVKELGLDPKNVKVSCAIPRDGAYGGAMGPAQFIPSTWKIYAPQVAKITGKPANPWNNADAFIATALYMKALGAANATIAQERTAAAKYYAGGNWSRFLWTYGQAVITRAAKFEDDIKEITS